MNRPWKVWGGGWLPEITIADADQWNPFAWSFDWGPLTVWNLSHITLSGEFVFDSNGFMIFVRIPYLCVKLQLLPEMPFLDRFQQKCDAEHANDE